MATLPPKSDRQRLSIQTFVKTIETLCNKTVKPWFKSVRGLMERLKASCNNSTYTGRGRLETVLATNPRLERNGFEVGAVVFLNTGSVICHVVLRKM